MSQVSSGLYGLVPTQLGQELVGALSGLNA